MKQRAAELALPDATSELSPDDFLRFQQLVYRASGIHLSAAKQTLLVGRLARRLRELGLRSLAEYYPRLTGGSAEARAELVVMLDAITTNETSFFREPQHFTFLEREIYPRWQSGELRTAHPSRIRVWSAGCSSGEEPYSLAMSLLEHFSMERDREIEIVATDLSTRVLAAAEAGEWPMQRAAELSPERLKRFMLRGVGSRTGFMKAGRELRSVVRCQRLNLYQDAAPPGKFDLVFCRNVLIYFDKPSRQRVIDKLLGALSPDGVYFLGHAESLHGMHHALRVAAPTIYSAAPCLAARGGA